MTERLHGEQHSEEEKNVGDVLRALNELREGKKLKPDTYIPYDNAYTEDELTEFAIRADEYRNRVKTENPFFFTGIEKHIFTTIAKGAIDLEELFRKRGMLEEQITQNIITFAKQTFVQHCLNTYGTFAQLGAEGRPDIPGKTC